MSRLREVKRHLHSLGEIRDIMNSMKSLAYMETRKLSSRLEAQHRITRHIGAAAADFLAFHPVLPQEDPEATRVRIVIGTERGFCGDFNQGLVRRLQADHASDRAQDTVLLVIGHKLHAAMEGSTPPAGQMIFIDGADVTEEAGNVINRVVLELDALIGRRGAIQVSSLHRGDGGELLSRDLLPPRFRDDAGATRTASHPPVLNLSPNHLLVELTDHYLFAALHEALYRSMLTENQHRVGHLDAAVQHLDRKSARLTHLANALHQEEIIEEIEVILLSGEGG